MRMKRRAIFNMSHVNSTTGNMGYIIPIMCQECLPGDSYQGDNKIVLRFAPLVAPVMHEAEQCVYTFFWPNRIGMDDWESFITGGQNGNDATVPPTISITATLGSLADYFGIPITENPLDVSALPFRAYAHIYNEFFRDQDLQVEVGFSTESGVDTETNTELLRANWQKDYFTTSRPWPQKGNAINIPLGDSAPLTISDTFNTVGNSQFIFNNRIADGVLTTSINQPGGAGLPGEWFASADLSNASTITVNELRQAFAYQRMSEERALTGSRYEDLLHVWGIATQDSRLQRPELISVRRSKIQFSEVLQTAPGADGTGVGNMLGHGISALRTGRWRYFCPEHGFIISLLVVRPKAVYTQGLERMWTRQTRYDYWNPEIQHIGQQEVLNREIFADGTSSDTEVFGYQNRYDEYRRGKNHVTGEFRGVLDYWNMARIFENRPALNSEFITCVPTDRVFQASDELAHQMYIMVRNDLIAKRLVSRNGKPI